MVKFTQYFHRNNDCNHEIKMISDGSFSISDARLTDLLPILK